MVNNERGQSLISKHVWMIETIHKTKKISFSEINRKWVQDMDISGGLDLPKCTFDNWRYAIQDIFGLIIENENKGEYRYYIMNDDDICKTSLRSWLYNTFCVSNVLANSQSIKDRILLEDVPSGKEYLQPIIDAMKGNRVINQSLHKKDESFNIPKDWDAKAYFEDCFEYSVFSYYLRPTFDFQQEILWNGENMEVMEPAWLRKEIAGKISRMWDKYKD